MSMPEQITTDVVVVGARCAGAAVAALAAHRGLHVVVVERSAALGETPSTHNIHVGGVRFLRRLGVVDRLLATGAPPLLGAEMHVDGVSFACPFPTSEMAIPGGLSVRRHVLDPILLDAAATAGADVRWSTRVTGLLRDGGRVSGVAVEDGGGGTAELRARLVVGADGRASTVARLAHARVYSRRPGERSLIWAYVPTTSIGSLARDGRGAWLQIHRVEDRFVLVVPTDDGLTQIVACLPNERYRQRRTSPANALAEEVAPFEPLSGAVAHPSLSETIRTCGPITSQFRVAAGAGWALVGDAGRQIDPTCGHGIPDAFEQAILLDRTVLSTMGPGSRLPASTSAYRVARDRLERPWMTFWERQARGGHLDPVERTALQTIATHPQLCRHLAEVAGKLRTPMRLIGPRLAFETLRNVPADKRASAAVAVVDLAAAEVRNQLSARLGARPWSRHAR
jgi:2-polyprenyl-6-methoxyphenol hydroxylase-like FAD-dependent oxidoreductase